MSLVAQVGSAGRIADGIFDNSTHSARRLAQEHERTARRVYGGEHPLVVQLKSSLQDARAVLRARETPSRSK